jgi:16S rRNA processing protein RimM
MRFSDDPRRFEPGARLLHSDGREMVVEASREHRDRFLVKFRGFDDRTAAETLRGGLMVPPESVRELGPGEYWPDDLVGCDVSLPDGRSAGRVAAVLQGIAHDLLAVETPRGERLVPLVQAIVTSIDPRAGRVVIDPPEGLLE